MDSNRLDGGGTPYDFLYSRKSLVAFLQANHLYFSKALGQNVFLNRELMVSLLNRAEFPTEGRVIEIGPGLGHLTWILIQRGLSVTAVEKDKTFSRLLTELATMNPPNADNLEVIHEDALKVDFASLAKDRQIEHVIGNLPYNVSVPLIFHLAYSGAGFKSLYFMIQKEVGERIAADCGTKNYGRLSIVLNYLFDVSKIRLVSPRDFFPQPNVESVFMKFETNEEADITFARAFLERVVHIGFIHRRKKLRKQFRGAVIKRRVFDDELMEKIEAAFDLDQRAEEWPLETWLRFARFVQDREPTKLD